MRKDIERDRNQRFGIDQTSRRRLCRQRRLESLSVDDVGRLDVFRKPSLTSKLRRFFSLQLSTVINYF